MDTIVRLLDDGVRFWVPPSLPDGIVFEGKDAVLRLFTESVGLYDLDVGLQIEMLSMTAEEDRVSAELTITSKSALGAPYHNFYHFLFRVRDGRIVEIREHLDSHYAFETLFVPREMTRRADCPWLTEEEKRR